MPVLPIERILRDLDSGNPEDAWTEFLHDYAALTFQVVRYFESDPDRASDCFQFVCERLVEDRFRRLRKFKVDGAAKFSTWLRAVVRNLCLDWHRKEFGRLRTFRSISRLSLFDHEVFRMIYERGSTTEECLHRLASRFPQASADQVAEARLRIEDALKPDQRLLLARRVARTTSATSLTSLLRPTETLGGRRRWQIVSGGGLRVSA